MNRPLETTIFFNQLNWFAQKLIKYFSFSCRSQVFAPQWQYGSVLARNQIFEIFCCVTFESPSSYLSFFLSLECSKWNVWKDFQPALYKHVDYFVFVLIGWMFLLGCFNKTLNWDEYTCMHVEESLCQENFLSLFTNFLPFLLVESTRKF